MEFIRKIIGKINANPFVRNLILAVCGIIVFAFVTNIVLNLFTRHGQVLAVPDFKGMTIDDALRAGKKASMRIEINDSLYIPAYPVGVVLEQSPAPGSQVKSGRRIFVTINSFKQKSVTIPYVSGFSLRQAKSILNKAGLDIEKLIYRSDIATFNVLEQKFEGKTITPKSKIEAEMGSGITLIVGLADGARPPAVPRLVGFRASDAKSRLWEAGFNLGKISYDEGVNLLNEKDARVSAQSPAVGSRPAHGTSINFTLSLDNDKVGKELDKAEKAAQAAAKTYLDTAKIELPTSSDETPE